MKKFSLLVALIFASSAWGSQVTVQMLNIPVSGSQPEPNFFLFNIDGQLYKLLCDQFLPNVTSVPYTAHVATLNDLTGTALIQQGLTPAEALQRYRWIAILDLWAYENPNLAPDVTWVNRFLTDTSESPKNLTPTQVDLLARVQDANPADYDLSGFKIYYGVSVATQEQTGHVPEPATFVLTLTAFAGFAMMWGKRRRA